MTDLLTEVLASCDRHGDAPAIGDVTYAELGRRIRAVAAGLVARACSLATGCCSRCARAWMRWCWRSVSSRPAAWSSSPTPAPVSRCSARGPRSPSRGGSPPSPSCTPRRHRCCARSHAAAASTSPTTAPCPEARHIVVGRRLPGTPRSSPPTRWLGSGNAAYRNLTARITRCRGAHHLHLRHHRAPARRRPFPRLARRRLGRLRRSSRLPPRRARAHRPAHGRHPRPHRRRALVLPARRRRPRRQAGRVCPVAQGRRRALRGARPPWLRSSRTCMAPSSASYSSVEHPCCARCSRAIREALPHTIDPGHLRHDRGAAGRDRRRRREARAGWARRLRRPPRAARRRAHRRWRGRGLAATASRSATSASRPSTEVRTGDLGTLDGDRLDAARPREGDVHPRHHERLPGALRAGDRRHQRRRRSRDGGHPG